MAQQLANQVPEANKAGRIAATFAKLKGEGRAALMPYLTVGYPDIETTSAAVPAMVRAGADLIELGMPFSDPLMDGPTVQRTNQIAIARGFKTAMMFDIAREIRELGIETPLILMGSFNPILRYGTDRFVAECAAAGIDGLIVPDLPPEESEEVEDACRRHGRDLIWLVAPTSSEERLADIASRASGFISSASPARGQRWTRDWRSISRACGASPICRWWSASASRAPSMSPRWARSRTARSSPRRCSTA
jgi:tryptophan synthase alpha chain